MAGVESVVTFFAEKLYVLIEQEVNLLSGVEAQIRSLHDDLDWIKCFLRDADEKRNKSKIMEVWVRQIRDLAFHAEDVIDVFLLRVEQQRQRNIGLRFINYHNKLKIRHKVAKQIEDINTRIEKISANRSKYGIEVLEARQDSDEGPRTRKQKRTSTVEEVDVVSFQKDKDELAKRLIQGELRRLAISIVGMGGLGKTTLAKQVYNCPDVKKHFDTCGWIYVSQVYQIRDLFQRIIKQVVMIHEEENKKLEKMNEEELRSELQKHLQEKRYLVVLDDIWDKETWDEFNAAFPDTTNGSRVMLTTRNRDVALHADQLIIPHELRFMDEMESWKLFCNKVFLMGNTCPVELVPVGKKIVEQCGGLPLAIVVLGGLLSVKDKTYTMWSKILDSVKWQLTQDSKEFMEILALSYSNLPYYLKSCFLYLGLFPEDLEINAEKLILLWIAEGFIPPRGEEKTEDVAEDCLEELIQRSMIQVTNRKANGGVLNCRIHDLLRDLAISESKKDRFLDAYGNNYSASTIRSRRLAIHHCNDEYQYHSDSTLNLRSLLFFTKKLEKAPKSTSFYGDIKLLSVLDLEGVRMEKLPKVIGELILLKYLGLRSTWLKRLPTCISNLGRLQTLDLRGTEIEGILNAIRKMKQLRHLYGVTYYKEQQLEDLSSAPKGLIPMGDLPRDLLTLELAAGSWIEGGLGKLSNLRQLMVVGVGVRDADALSNAIVKLECLRSLMLLSDDFHDVYWNSDSKKFAFSTSFDKPITTELPPLGIAHHHQLYELTLHGRLQNQPNNPLLDFPQKLTELHLSYSHLEQDPAATLEKLPNLKVLLLGINSYTGKKMICSAEGFPRLQFLQLFCLRDLEEWRLDVGAMPSLKDLIINYCNNLKMLPDGLRHIITLQKIELLGMPVAIKARVEENGEDWDKIKHVPSITIKD